LLLRERKEFYYRLKKGGTIKVYGKNQKSDLLLKTLNATKQEGQSARAWGKKKGVFAEGTEIKFAVF